MSWHDLLRPASFRGVQFKVQAASRAGGRRGQTWEYPKAERNDDEDMGRRARRSTVTGYVVGSDYQYAADDLEDALSREGAGLLIHPVMGEMTARCEVYTRSERKNEGGMATFDMIFVEAPSDAANGPSEDTQGNVEQRAYALDQATLGGMDASIKAGPK
jgi:prophage DNA circulation protein